MKPTTKLMLVIKDNKLIYYCRYHHKKKWTRNSMPQGSIAIKSGTSRTLKRRTSSQAKNVCVGDVDTDRRKGLSTPKSSLLGFPTYSSPVSSVNRDEPA